MAKRKIVKIDEEKCTGCGLCIPNCAEGALKIINGKAKLVSDKFCDGLGTCLGHCPENAITIIEREAEEFDEKAVKSYLESYEGCPSTQPLKINGAEKIEKSIFEKEAFSELTNWPIQLKLVPINAPYFNNRDLLISADCVSFSYSDFHRDFLKGHSVVIGCPKLDDAQLYKEKLIQILKENTIRSITIAYMEVPCCSGILRATEDAISASGKKIPINKIRIGIRGEIKLYEKGNLYPIQID